MSQLVASYATDRYLLRLIQPDTETNGMILVASGPTGQEDFTGGADIEIFESAREACQRAEDNYWRSVLSIALPEDRDVLLSGWQHFRRYAGLPDLNLEEHDGNNQQADG